MEDNRGSLKPIGAWTLIIGVFCSVGAQFMPTTASYSDTLNIGLLQTQMMAFQAALVTSLIGAMMMLTGQVIERLSGPRPAPGALPPEPLTEPESVQAQPIPESQPGENPSTGRTMFLVIPLALVILLVIWFVSMPVNAPDVGNDALENASIMLNGGDPVWANEALGTDQDKQR